MDKQLDQLAVGHQKLWYEIHIPVATPAVALIRVGPAELLEDILQRGQGGRLATIVLVPEIIKIHCPEYENLFRFSFQNV